MKNRITFLGVLAGVVAAVSVQAIPTQINGSIAFGGSAKTDNLVNFGLSTKIVSYPATFVTPGEQTGDYAAVPDFHAVTFSPFTFAPPAGSVVPLWTLTEAGITYSFDATTMTAHFDATRNEWDLGGKGTADITGYLTTPGVWNINVSKSGASFSFGSTAAVAGVPDGGMALALLGFALVGVEGLRRKLS